MDDEPVTRAWIGKDGEQDMQRVVVQDDAGISGAFTFREHRKKVNRRIAA